MSASVTAFRGRPVSPDTDEDRRDDATALRAEEQDVIRLSAYLWRSLPIGSPQRTAAARVVTLLDRQRRQRPDGDAA